MYIQNAICKQLQQLCLWIPETEILNYPAKIKGKTAPWEHHQETSLPCENVRLLSVLKVLQRTRVWFPVPAHNHLTPVPKALNALFWFPQASGASGTHKWNLIKNFKHTRFSPAKNGGCLPRREIDRKGNLDMLAAFLLGKNGLNHLNLQICCLCFNKVWRLPQPWKIKILFSSLAKL